MNAVTSSSAPQRIPGPGILWATVQLSALSFHFPLVIIIGSQRALVGVASALLLGLTVCVVSLLAYFTLRRVSGSGWRALAWTSVVIVFFWQWNATDSDGLPSWLIPAVTFTLAMIAAGRFAERRWVRLAVFAISVTLSSTFLFMFAIEELTTPPPVVEMSGGPDLADLANTPDIVFLVLDGYARDDVLRKVYGFDNTGFLNELQSLGFTTFASANANYAGTHLSLPSVLNMTYVADDGDVVTNSDLDALARTISGDNLLVHTLKANGYTYLHGDTDNWMNSCGPEVDECLPGSFLELTAYALLGATPIGPLLYQTSGDPITSMNLTRIEQLGSWSELRETLGADPNFAFLHLILPHPPLYLDSTCELNVAPGLGGRILYDGQIDEDWLTERKQAYVDQTRCANQTVLDFMGKIDRNTVVVVTADHGPDSYGVMAGHADQWSPEQIWERLAAFSAIRLPESCDAPEGPDLELVNTFRIVLSCLTDEEIPLLDGKYFGAPFGGSIFELKDPDSDVD